MGLDSIRDAFRQRWSKLPGDAIRRVLYYEIAYEAGLKGWSTAGSKFDTVDFGVEFHFLSDTILSVVWGRDLVQYGLTIVDGSLSASLQHFAVHDVSAESHWASNLGRRIETAELMWNESELEPERGAYVQTAWLVLEGDAHVYISAAEYRLNPPTVLTMMDNILIVFDKDVAVSSGILLKD